MRYVAGLDGGGTKTEVAVAGMDGRIVHTFTSGPINVNSRDEAGIRSTVQSIMQTIAGVCGGLDHCVQLCVGAAGVGNPRAGEFLAAVIRETGYRGGLTITGDHEAALYGAVEDGYGVIVIAGTGSVCYGRNETGQSFRTGGWGHLIDDEGSGYSIGRDLLAAVVRAHDGRIPQTAITELVYEQLRVRSVAEIIRFVYDRNTVKQDIAALAPLLSKACEAGDREALAIAARNARALFKLAAPVVERLGLQRGMLAMAGSVLINNAHIRQSFRERLLQAFPDLACIPARNPASAGAAFLALRHWKEASHENRNED